MAEVEDRLVVRMEATLARFEKQMARARQAANTNATGIEERFDRMGSRMGQSSEKAARGLSNVVNISSRGRFVIQNTAAQLGDMAVQLESGTAASRVMAQQLPQILGGFGALGGVLGIIAPLLGTVAAIGIPVAAALYSIGADGEDAGKKVKTFADMLGEAEGALSRAEKAMSTAADGGVEDLLVRYGEVTEAVRTLADELAEIEKRAAKVEVGKVIEAALGDGFKRQIEEVFGGIGSAIVSVDPEDIEAAKAAVQEIGAEITNLEALNQLVPQALRDDFAAAQEELAALEGRFSEASSLLSGMKLSPELAIQIADTEAALRAAFSAGDFAAVAANFALIRDLLRESGEELEQGVIDALVQAEDQTRALAEQLGQSRQNAEDTATAAGAIGGALGSGVSAAAALAANLGISLDTARKLAALGPQGVITDRDANGNLYGGRGGDPRKMGGTASEWQTADAIDFLDNYKPPRASRGRSGGGGSGAKAKVRDPQSIIENAQAQVQALERQIEMIGKTDAEVASLTLRYRALDEAKKMGVDVDREMADSGRTLRQEIDAQAKAVEDLSRQYEAGQVAQSFFEDSVDGIADALAGALTGAKSFRESMAQVFQGIAQDILRAGIRQAITSVFSKSSGGGGGGFLSSIVGAFLPGRAKSFDGGGYTGSGPRSGGVDGKGGFPAILHPREVVHDLTKGQGGVGGQSVVRVELSDGLVAAILQEARGQSLQITHRAVGAQQSSLMGRVQSMEERGTTR
ncbi:hypothetical protein [Pseudooceanicola sp.]|uniref:hypothetical protein n=1 Tax=Pseudooceanicola sp. TaxID=1914328 RepID=UPI003519A1F0